MTKNTIIFKRNYVGANQPHIRHGARIWLELDKRDVLIAYERTCNWIQLTERPKLSLLMFVRQYVDKVCETAKMHEL